MVCLFCQCLNVTVHCKETSWKTRAVSASQLFPDGSKERLVTRGESVYEVDLDVAGVFTEHKALVVVHTVGDWVIHRCSNCDTDVYISHSVKDGKTFVTGKLLSEPAEAQAAKSHKSYSQVFKIIIREVPDENEFRRKRVSSMTFGREDPVMKLAHAQMKSYLNREQEAMEERIRKYEEKERDVFSQLQTKAHSDRTTLFAAIAKARENVISDAIRDSMTITTHTYTEPVNSMTFTNSSPTKRPALRKVPSPFEQPQQKVTITLQDQKPRTKSPEIDDPAMFSLDGFDEGELLDDPDGVAIATGGGVAFPQSDDEEVSTDDSSYRDMSALSAGGVAMSVPLGIPMFTRTKDTTDGVNQDVRLQAQEERDFDPDRVVNSIRALALSVQDTGMFGDLPRPRIMTNPYAKRW